MGQAGGILLAIVILGGLAATDAMDGLSGAQRTAAILGVVIGFVAAGMALGWVDARRWRSAILFVDEQVIRLEVDGEEAFYSRWADVRVRRTGLFGHAWEVLDPAGRVLPFQRFPSSSDVVRLRRVLRSRVPKGERMTRRSKAVWVVASGLLFGLGLMMLEAAETALQGGQLGLAIAVKVVGGLLAVPLYLGLILQMLLWGTSVERATLKRGIRRYPEVAYWWEQAGSFGQGRLLEPGVWHRYVVPDRLRPGRLATKFLEDEVMLTGDGILRVRRKDDAFECTGPGTIRGQMSVTRAFGSYEVWRRGRRSYVIDRRFLEPLVEPGSTERRGELLENSGVR